MEPFSPFPDRDTLVLLVIESVLLRPVSSNVSNLTSNTSIDVSIVILPVNSSEVFPAMSVAVTTHEYSPSNNASSRVICQEPPSKTTTSQEFTIDSPRFITNVTVEPTSAIPLNTGSVLLVIPSELLVPESDS